MYSLIKTFSELCEIGCEFVSSNIKSHPFLIVDESKTNLYELVGDLEWIQDYIYKFNKLGFYTVMSQPGSDYPTQIYPTRFDYKKSFSYSNSNPNSNSNIKKTFRVAQRAEVQGFMKWNDALKLYNQLNSNQNLIVGISTKSNEIIITSNYNELPINKYATLSYELVNPNPNQNQTQQRFMEEEDNYNIGISTKTHGINRDKKLSMMKHLIRRYFQVRNYPLKKHIPNLIDEDVVGVSIMELKWNSNEHLWIKVLDVLKNIYEEKFNS